MAILKPIFAQKNQNVPATDFRVDLQYVADIRNFYHWGCILVLLVYCTCANPNIVNGSILLISCTYLETPSTYFELLGDWMARAQRSDISRFPHVDQITPGKEIAAPVCNKK